MTIKHDYLLDVDYHISEDGSEMMVSIRTANGEPLDPQDAFDGYMSAHEEAFGTTPIPITIEDIKNDKNIH